MKVKNSLVIALSDPSNDPRPYRTINILKDLEYSVDLISFRAQSPLPVRKHYLISRSEIKSIFKKIERKVRLILLLWYSLYSPLLTIKSIQQYLKIANLAELLSDIDKNYNLIVVEDLYLLPFGLACRGQNTKVLFDAREFYPRQYEQSLRFRLLEQPLLYQLCHRYLKQCDQVITVSNGLVQEYKRVFNIDTALIRSVPLSVSCQIKPVANDKIKMVHHGGANRNRKLENMIFLFDYLEDRFTLDFYLVGNDPYIAELKEMARKRKNITFCEPVKFQEIIPMLNNYDVGLCLFEPLTFNLKYCLPNKLFEFIQARLMVAIAPSPDMAEIVIQYQCGLVSEDFSPQAMARCLNSLTAEQIYQHKLNCDLAARELNWESESAKLQRIIENLVNRNG